MTAELPLTSVDCVIGGIVVLLTVIGILGNLPSFLYFWKRRKKTIHDFLYTIISVIDILTSSTSIPVISSLLNSRAPMLFNNSVICITWPVVSYLLIRLSTLLVMFISATRAVAIVQPLQRNQVVPSHMAVVMVGYGGLLIIVDVILLSSGLIEGSYVQDAALCEIEHEEMGENVGLTRFYSVSLQLELMLPCLVVFVSFVASTICLFRIKAVQSTDQKKFRRVSITIALFTALFLVCYLPCFSIYFVSLLSLEESGGEHSAFHQYSHLLFQFVLPLLNAAMNPCLYLLRMPKYRKWLGKVLRDPAKAIKDFEFESNVGTSLEMQNSKFGRSFTRMITQVSSLRLTGN